MLKYAITYVFYCFFTFQLCAQVDNQVRYFSDYRQYFVWSNESQSYILKETEYENSVIDIREINSRSNGYVAISVADDGKARLYHGSISAFSVNEKQEPTWQLRSKNMRSKLTLNPESKTFTYVYEANEQRYQKILVFTLRPDPELSKTEGQ